MFLNNYSVRVPEGNEIPGGYVELIHGQQYSLVLANKNDLRCDVSLEIDGKSIGTWRIDADNSIRLERPPHDKGKFTFYKLGTTEAIESQLVKTESLGLIKAVFTPEKPMPKEVFRHLGIDRSSQSFNVKGLSSGGTGLSGISRQKYGTAERINLDYARQTTIHLRLVCENKSEQPRPLTAYSTQVPPLVE